jgi:Ulp1 family protease
MTCWHNNDKIVLPLHLGNHWALVVINNDVSTIGYYDSCQNHTWKDAETRCDNARRWLTDE